MKKSRNHWSIYYDYSQKLISAELSRQKFLKELCETTDEKKIKMLIIDINDLRSRIEAYSKVLDEEYKKIMDTVF